MLILMVALNALAGAPKNFSVGSVSISVTTYVIPLSFGSNSCSGLLRFTHAVGSSCRSCLPVGKTGGLLLGSELSLRGKPSDM